MCLHSWQHKTAGDNTVLGHQLILYMGRISPCRACRSMSPALEQRRGLPGEPSAGHDCVPCVCPMSSLRLSGRRSSLDPAPCPSPRVNKRPTQRAGETSRQMRCSPGNVGLDGSPWAAVFRSRHSQRRAGLSLGCSVKHPQPSGWRWIVTPALSLSSGVRVLSVVQAVDVPSHVCVLTSEQAVANVTRNPCKLYPLLPQPSSLSPISRGPGECLCSSGACLLHTGVGFRFAY